MERVFFLFILKVLFTLEIQFHVKGEKNHCDTESAANFVHSATVQIGDLLG